METELREVLERGAAPPRHVLDVEGLWRSAQRRRRRRRTGAAVVSVALASVTIATVISAVGSSGANPRVRVAPIATAPRRVENAAAQLAWALPTTWQTNPLVADASGSDGSTATEELAAGTASRPDGIIAAICGGHADEELGATNAFVSLREYAAEADPTVRARPSAFTPQDAAPVGLCPTPAGYRFESVDFVDQGRAFVAFIVFGPGVSQDAENDAWALLNSLAVRPLTQPSRQTSQQIAAAFRVAVNDRAGFRDAIEDGNQLPAEVETRISALGNTGAYSIDTDHIVLIDPQTARLTYRLKIGGGDFQSGIGTAVKIDGGWKVSWETACDWVQTLSLTCPPHP